MEAIEDLRAFILIIGYPGFCVWLFTGGPLRPSSKSGWFLNKPRQKATQKTKEQTEEILGTTSSSSKSNFNHLPSPSSIRPDFVAINIGRARETNPDEEYLEIKTDKKNKKSDKDNRLETERQNRP